MRNKFGNKKITYLGETFDSKRKYERYRETASGETSRGNNGFGSSGR